MLDTNIPIRINRDHHRLRLIIDVPADQQASVNQAIEQLQAEQRPVGGLIVESLLTAVEQAYFWTPDWQAKEQAADADLAAGRYQRFDSMDDLLGFLDAQ